MREASARVGESPMTFNAIIGNPPYQQMDGGHGVSATPLYNWFVERAKALEPKYLSMIIPSRWFSGGKYLDDFREAMLKDDQLFTLFDYETSAKLFPGVDIAGGVCYFLWEKGHHGKCQVTNCLDDRRISLERKLNEYSSLIRSNQAVSILQKVISAHKKGDFLSDSVSSRKPFGLATNYSPYTSGIPCWFIQKIGLQFAKKEDVQDPNGYLPKWKFLIPPAPIAGQTDFSKPISFFYEGNTRIAKPGECCTESWLVAFAADTKKEVESFKSYLFTKTVRFLLLQTVVSQHVVSKNFKFVPDLNQYTGKYTDEQLCNRWHITREEWSYIDSKIK